MGLEQEDGGLSTTTNSDKIKDDNTQSLSPLAIKKPGLEDDGDDPTVTLNKFFENSMNIRATMEHQLRVKDTKIEALEERITANLEDFEKRVSSWQQEKTKLTKRCSLVKIEGDASLAEVKTTHLKDVEALKEQIISLEEALEKKELYVKQIENELKARENELSTWTAYISILEDLDFEEFVKSMEAISKSAYKLAIAHFLIDLPVNQFENSVRWEGICRTLDTPLFIPSSNSEAAKLARVAAFLRVFSIQLFTHIFKSCYLPESFDKDTIRSILNLEYNIHPQNERVTRGLLFSAYPSEVINFAIAEAVQNASDNIMALLELFLDEKDKSFQKELNALLSEAANLWAEAQYSKSMVKVIIEVEDGADDEELNDVDWDILEDFDEFDPPTEAESDRLPPRALCLFPRLYIPEDKRVVHPGIALWSDQNAVLAAGVELWEIQLARRSKGRRGSASSALTRPGRRLSLAGYNSGSAAAPSSPSSPRTGYKTFASRVNSREE